MGGKLRIKRVRDKTLLFPSPALLPGLRGGADWHVHASPEDTAQGSTINVMGHDGSMMVPAGDDADSKFTRLHELLHAAHSPLSAPGPVTMPDGTVISQMAILMAEEVRIDSIARTMAGKANLPPGLRSKMDEHLAQLVPLYAKSGKPELGNEIVAKALAAWAEDENHMGAQSDVVKTINRIAYSDFEGIEQDRLIGLIKVIDTALSRIFDSVWKEEFEDLFEDQIFPDWESVLVLAEFIDTVFEATGEIGKAAPKPMPVAPDLQVLQTTMTPDDLGNTMRIQIKLDEGLSKQGFKPPVEYDINIDEVVWGEMETRRPKRPMRLPRSKSSRSKYQATDAGASPRYIHRLLTDGQVFARKKRIPGGSVLIDDSGSMRWKNEDVAKIVEAAPAVDIAAYSGSSTKGTLVIISEDGTWCDAKENRPAGGGNLVDMPALEWLATKKEPRIWVSDQLVVPMRGSMQEAAKEVMAFVQANNINVVANATEASQVFTGKKAIYR